MQLKKQILIFLITSQSLTVCKPPLATLLGFYQSFKNQGIYELCPLRGMIAVETNLLKNQWRYGNKNHAMIKLIKTLFYTEEGDEFFITTYMPYKNFNYQTISVLSAGAYNQTLYKKNNDKKYSSIQDLTKTFKGNKMPSRLQELIRLIKHAHKEEHNNLYPNGTLYQILSAVLYYKTTTLENLIDYATDLSERLEKKLSYESNMSLQSFDSSSTIDNNEALQFIQNNIESLIIQQALELHYHSDYPPKAEWARGVVYKNNTPISNCCETVIRSFINELCYDSQLKKFDLNRLPKKLYEKIPNSVKNFYLMYQSAETEQEINKQELHNDWMNVVSELPETLYRKNNYEIHPSLINIIHILKILCGIDLPSNHSLTTTEHLKQFCIALSNPPLFSLRFLKASCPDDICTNVSFAINRRSEQKITIHIRKDHAWLSQDYKDEHYNSLAMIKAGTQPLTFFSTVCHYLNQKLTESPPLDLIDCANLYAPYLDLTLINDNELLKTLLFSNPTTLEFEKYRTFKKICTHYKNNQDSSLLSFAIALVTSLYDSSLSTHALTLLINCDYHKIDIVKNCILEILPQLEKFDQQTTLMALIRKKLWHDNDYKQLIITTLPNIINYEQKNKLKLDNKALVMQQLLENKADEDNDMQLSMNMLLEKFKEKRAQRFKRRLAYISSENS